MEIEKYKTLYEKYSRLGLHHSDLDNPEYDEYLKAFHEEKLCSEWYYKRTLEDRKFDYSYHCCLEMAYHLSAAISNEAVFDDPDVIIMYNEIFDEYGIPIHDGGNACIKIEYCPWCGSKLPDSKRDEWFEELLKRGIDAFGEDEIPSEFKSDKWYRKSNA